MEHTIEITTPFIKLEALLKKEGLTGGMDISESLEKKQ